ncbi:MAG: zf-HC2 domain-containing protein [candidate division Zixibacteria bacterium]|nr:zf-HC2 domain-containing protein [candidate division Zixibacteria bacterium]
MNCREALLHLYEYLDKELTEDTVRKIEAHLTTCEHCFDKYEFEKMLHKVIAEKGHAEVDSEPLKAKVLARIAEIDGNEQSSGFFSRFRPYLATAVALAVIGLTLFSILDLNSSDAYASLRPIVDNHLQKVVSAEGSTVKKTMSEIEESLNDFVTVPEEFFRESSDRIATRGFPDSCSNSEAVHLVYEYLGSNVSVYIIPDSAFQPCPKLEVMQNGHNKYHYGLLDGINVIMWQCKGLWCIAAADTEVEDLMHFASAY